MMPFFLIDSIEYIGAIKWKKVETSLFVSKLAISFLRSIGKKGGRVMRRHWSWSEKRCLTYLHRHWVSASRFSLSRSVYWPRKTHTCYNICCSNTCPITPEGILFECTSHGWEAIKTTTCDIAHYFLFLLQNISGCHDRESGERYH